MKLLSFINRVGLTMCPSRPLYSGGIADIAGNADSLLNVSYSAIPVRTKNSNPDVMMVKPAEDRV